MHVRKSRFPFLNSNYICPSQASDPSLFAVAAPASLLAAESPFHVLLEQWVVINPGQEIEFKGIIIQ